MKIITWNVNGYRAAWKKGFADWLTKESPDVLCVQEIKGRPDQFTEEQRNLPGYTAVWNPAIRPGYSGVAMFIRDGLNIGNVMAGIPDERFDDEGRVLQAEIGDVVLYGIYFPNGQRGQERVTYKLDFYASLLQRVKAQHGAGKKVIITGDFNTAHQPIDLKNPKENEKTSGFLPEERAWVDTYLGSGLADAYRRLYPEKVEYTWWSMVTRARDRNIGWRLDYFLVTEALMSKVKEVRVMGDVMGSDHCPVLLEIDLD